MNTRRNNLRSIAVRVAVFLLLGAVVNVAVAWGLAACRVSMPVHFERASPNTTKSDTHISRGIGELAIWQSWSAAIDESLAVFTHPDRVDEGTYRSMLPWWSTFNDAEPAQGIERSGINANVTYIESAFGWPCLSMWCTEVRRVPIGGVNWVNNSDAINPPAFVAIWLNQNDFRATFPARPLPGFAINTLFFAATLWLLFAAPGRVQRWRRVRRGLCVRCAYPVGPGRSDVCTECGAAIRRVS